MHWEALLLRIRPEAHDEQVAVELQTEQLETEQLKGHILLLRT
jgi:hypothetical protein